MGAALYGDFRKINVEIGHFSFGFSHLSDIQVLNFFSIHDGGHSCIHVLRPSGYAPDCGLSNVYSSHIIFASIPPKLLSHSFLFIH